MHIRNDVVVSKNKRSKSRPWTVRWWGKYDIIIEKQPRHSKSFSTKKKAEKYAQSLKDDIYDGISVEPMNITVAKLWEKYLNIEKNKLEPSSLSNYRQTAGRLINYFGSHRNIKSINKEQAEEFLADIKLLDGKGPSDSTRARHLRNAKLIFNKAVEWEYIRKNPFKGIKLGKPETEDWRFITPDEFKCLINAIDSIPIRIKVEKLGYERKTMLKAFYSIMYGCGLRFGEAANLMWDNGNIDFINSKINLSNRNSSKELPPFKLKNHQARTIHAPNWVMGPLKNLKEISSPNSPFVFLNPTRLGYVKAKWQELKEQGREDKWLNSMMILNTHRKFHLYCQKAGIITNDRLSVHCLRKSYGTNLADAGTPVHTLKDMMGHSDIKTTMSFYIKSTDANKQKAVEALERMMGA
ncbi:MAG: site-specific integrase [Phycisphaerae bacterium]|nr:site-specific integrase [Phycisphaerae bacterium]